MFIISDTFAGQEVFHQQFGFLHQQLDMVAIPTLPQFLGILIFEFLLQPKTIGSLNVSGCDYELMTLIILD
jgi:hypothetical protein